MYSPSCATALSKWAASDATTIGGILREYVAYLTLVNTLVVLLVACVMWSSRARHTMLVVVYHLDILASSLFVLLASFLVLPWERLHVNLVGNGEASAPAVRCTWRHPGVVTLFHLLFHVLPVVIAALIYGDSYRARPSSLVLTFALIGVHVLAVDQRFRYYPPTSDESSEDRWWWSVLYVKGVLSALVAVAITVAYHAYLVGRTVA